MKSIIITGEQGVGKSTFARQIAEKYGNYAETADFNEIKLLLRDGAKCIIIDDLSISQKNIKLIKEWSSITKTFFRKPYSEKSEDVDISNVLLIAIFQEWSIQFTDSRHSIVFHLKSDK